MFAYAGELEVQDGDFYLYADRLIVRDGEVAFMFSGSDEYGDFKIEGVAKQSNQGNYIASQTKLVYTNYISDDIATIQFDVIGQTDQKLRCHIEGKWLQGSSWLFSGNLRKYKN